MLYSIYFTNNRLISSATSETFILTSIIFYACLYGAKETSDVLSHLN